MNSIVYDFVEIGTSNFDTELQKANNEVFGISVEPIKRYLDNIPNKTNCIKSNYAISNYKGTIDIYYVSPEIIKEYKFPQWFTGCNSVNDYHPTVKKILTERGLSLEKMVTVETIDVIQFKDLVDLYNIEGIKYLKIDTEGHDCVILNDYLDLIQETNNRSLLAKEILFESNVLSNADEINKIIERLEEFGYIMITKGVDTKMVLQDITYISAFYDLEKYEKRPYGKSKLDYMEYAEFLFKMKVNMIFFVSEEDAEYVLKRREYYGNVLNTKVIVKELQCFEYYEYLNTQSEALENRHKKHVRDTKLYHVLTWIKIMTIKDGTEIDPYSTKYFGWIDFGIFRVVKDKLPDDVISHILPITDKIRLLELDYVRDKTIEDLSKYCQIYSQLAAGIITGSKSNILELVNLFDQKLKFLLSEGFVVHEELILGILYVENRELFSTFFGYYCDIILNYNKLREPADQVFINLKTCRHHSEHKQAVLIGKQIYQNTFSILPVNKKHELFYNLIISLFYINKIEGNRFCGLWVDNLRKDKELLTYFVNTNYNHFIHNLNFYSIKDKEDISEIIKNEKEKWEDVYNNLK